MSQGLSENALLVLRAVREGSKSPMTISAATGLGETGCIKALRELEQKGRVRKTGTQNALGQDEWETTS
jgi:hypothetical protein